ncbi:hypothetical protein HUG15_11695 [Salicibibacter cibarius]|uniref:Uncharacterized protein n=1 Tax=Salicibibacter cibarius TaxID=2743000 RepID=A0A7T7CBM9_9BACI|nr:hypothetical protein HUG15_11695 [Salicibibacter cibarius]
MIDPTSPSVLHLHSDEDDGYISFAVVLATVLSGVFSMMVLQYFFG